MKLSLQSHADLRRKLSTTKNPRKRALIVRQIEQRNARLPMSVGGAPITPYPWQMLR